MTREAEFAKVIDLSTLLKPYKGKWVILSEDKSRVLYSADTMDDAVRESEKFKTHAILIRVPDENTLHLLQREKGLSVTITEKKGKAALISDSSFEPGYRNFHDR